MKRKKIHRIRPPVLTAKACPHCGREFTAAVRNKYGNKLKATFCSMRCRVQARYPEPVERFWERVSKGGPDECWPWIAYRNDHGYGIMYWTGRRRRASHVAYLLAHGSIPAGLWVLHKCDNPACVNPAHLFPGNCKANNTDMMLKGRHSNGLRKASSNPETVRLIRARYKPKVVTMKILADEYQISERTVYLIVHRQIWKHVA